jgi:hypothetical protein
MNPQGYRKSGVPGGSMKKADEVIRAFIPMLGSREGQDYLNLFSSWTAILGEGLEDIAAHTEPVDVKGGSLILFVDHPGWMQKLEFHKPRILKILQKRYPELGIRSIFVQRVTGERFLERREARLLGNNPTVAADSGKPAVPPPAAAPDNDGSSADAPDADAVPRLPEDPELAETFRRLVELSKNAKKR